MSGGKGRNLAENPTVIGPVNLSFLYFVCALFWLIVVSQENATLCSTLAISIEIPQNQGQGQCPTIPTLFINTNIANLTKDQHDLESKILRVGAKMCI